MNIKENVITYKTDEYNKFKKLDGNRTINYRNVNAIIKNITENGYKPTIVIVNERFEVIDGQHRIEALQKLNLPVEYQIRDGLTIQDAVALNVANRTWKTLDYIESYASLGYQDYISLFNLIKSFPKVTLSTIIEIAGDTDSFGGGVKNALMQGEFKIKKELLDISDQLQFIEDFKKIDLSIKGRAYYLEIILARLLESNFIDSERMLSQIEKYGLDLLTSVVNVKDGLEKLESIYNFRKTNKVRFTDKYYEQYVD